MTDMYALVCAALRAYGEATLPADFDADLRTFDELMAAIKRSESRIRTGDVTVYGTVAIDQTPPISPCGKS